MKLPGIAVHFRPIGVGDWPGQMTAERAVSPFTASWSDTQELLARELRLLGADDVVVQVAVAELNLRRDGLPRAHAKTDHPGVILAFDTADVGAQRYAADLYDRRYAKGPEGWQHNVRAIALGLQALRAVSRYGIVRDGEQYRGFTAIGPGAAASPDGHRSPTGGLTARDAAEFVATWGGDELGAAAAHVAVAVLDDAEVRKTLYRRAARRLHPDTSDNADPALWATLQQAGDVLAQHATRPPRANRMTRTVG